MRMHRGVLLGICLALLVAAPAIADTGVVSTPDNKICAACDFSWASLPSNAPNQLTPYVFVEPATGCENETVAYISNCPALAGSIAVFLRGGCYFSTKIVAAKECGAVGVIIGSLNNASVIAPQARDAGDYDLANIPACMVSWDDYISMNRTAARRAGMYQPAPGGIDPNLVLFFLLAVGTVFLGSLWFTANIRRGLAKGSYRALGTAAGEEGGDGDEEQTTTRFTPVTVIVFLVAACGFLLLMYIAYKYLIFVAIAIFALFGAVGLSEVVFVPFEHRPIAQRTVSLACLGHMSVLHLGLFACCAALAVVWAVCRHAPWAWVLQDTLGVAFLLTCIKSLQLPSLKVATFLLVAFLFYDVFFVFITPLFTANHDSVMVHAATGGDDAPSESLPFLIKIPRFRSTDCASSEYSMLGFGDIALPALLVAFCLRFDYSILVFHLRRGASVPSSPLLRYSYFIAALLAYAVGLMLAFAVMLATHQPQPALLYLVPCTLGVTWAMAYHRGHLRTLLAGESAAKPAGDDPERNGGAAKEDEEDMDLHLDEDDDDDGARPDAVPMVPSPTPHDLANPGRPLPLEQRASMVPAPRLRRTGRASTGSDSDSDSPMLQ